MSEQPIDIKKESTLGWAQPCKGSLIPRHHSPRNNPNRKAVKETWRWEVEVMEMEMGRDEDEVREGKVI